jgi:hypothetical protein
MFAKAHYVDDSHALRSLDTRLGASFNVVLLVAVAGIFVFVYGEPNVLVTETMVPAPQVVLSSSNSSSNAYYGGIVFHGIAYAPQNLGCAGMKVPEKGLTSGMECTSATARIDSNGNIVAAAATASKVENQRSICEVNVTCLTQSSFRGTESVMLEIPDPFQTIKWDVTTSKWSPSSKAVKISHVLKPSWVNHSLPSSSSSQLSGTFASPTRLNFGAIRSVVNDTRFMDSTCIVRGVQLLWRETEKTEDQQGTKTGSYFVQFRISVDESVFTMILTNKLTEAEKLSMVLTYFLSLIASIKIIKIVIQLILDKVIVILSDIRNVHVPKDVKRRVAILEEHQIEKHEASLSTYHAHFQSMGLFGIQKEDGNALVEDQNDDDVAVEMVPMSTSSPKPGSPKPGSPKPQNKISTVTNPLAVASERKKMMVMEKKIAQQQLEIEELKRMFAEIQVQAANSIGTGSEKE